MSGPPKFDSIPPDVEWDEYVSPIPGRPSVWIPRIGDEATVPEDVKNYILNTLAEDLKILEKMEKSKQTKEMLRRRKRGIGSA